ncbi:putative phage-associated protein [Bradyrhizobium sp. AZCC 1610]|uniref:Panacea domain-containing protein n=1 Tax=Bradyrhizobium sp. AZCC 1610 TaxID=3117020 RepID=UPI002FF25971
MAIPTTAAARYVCARGNWNVTNLALQKILYLAHMVHLGRTGQRLIDGEFEAWDYGPVNSDLYRTTRIFGDKPIQNIFFGTPRIFGTPEEETLREACERLLTKSSSELVAMTHQQNGAWAKHYVPGVRSAVIPDTDIIAEYNTRLAEAH